MLGARFEVHALTSLPSGVRPSSVGVGCRVPTVPLCAVTEGWPDGPTALSPSLPPSQGPVTSELGGVKIETRNYKRRARPTLAREQRKQREGRRRR